MYTAEAGAWRSRGITGALVSTIVLLWVIGAALIWSIYNSQVDIYGLQQSDPRLQGGDPFFLVPALLTIPIAIAVGWAVRRSANRWPLSIMATMVAVALAVIVPAFIVALRFAGDRSPVETLEIEFAWFVYGFTAGLHALVLGVAAWRFR